MSDDQAEFPDPVGETATEAFERMEQASFSQREEPTKGPVQVVAPGTSITVIATPDQLDTAVPFIDSFGFFEPCSHATNQPSY